MWKNIMYLLGAAGIFYLAVLYNSKALFCVCFAAVSVPLLFLGVLSYIKQRLKFELLFYSYPITDSGDYLVGLGVENPSKIYLPRIRARIRVVNTATGRIEWVKAEGRVPAEGSAELSGRVKEPEFGLWQAECQDVRCYEWTNFLHLRPSVQERRQILVYPAVYAVNIKIGIRTRLFWSDGEQYHPQVSGDDPSETLKLREYQKGDRLNRVHWKLSAKNDNLIVAELGMPMGCNVAIFLDGKPVSMGRKEVRAYWAVLHSLSQELLAQECPHYLVWRDRQCQELLCRKAVRKVEDLMDFWCEIPPDRMERGAEPTVYARNFPGEMYASHIAWNQEMELWCNSKLEAEIKPEQVKEQLAELELLL